jgi:hypothetical protein
MKSVNTYRRHEAAFGKVDNARLHRMDVDMVMELSWLQSRNGFGMLPVKIVSPRCHFTCKIKSSVPRKRLPDVLWVMQLTEVSDINDGSVLHRYALCPFISCLACVDTMIVPCTQRIEFRKGVRTMSPFLDILDSFIDRSREEVARLGVEVDSNSGQQEDDSDEVEYLFEYRVLCVRTGAIRLGYCIRNHRSSLLR